MWHECKGGSHHKVEVACFGSTQTDSRAASGKGTLGGGLFGVAPLRPYCRGPNAVKRQRRRSEAASMFHLEKMRDVTFLIA